MTSLSSINKSELFFNKIFPNYYSFVLSRSIYAITKLGVADALKGIPLSIGELAQRQNIKAPEHLARLMNFLAAQGIFSTSDEGYFSHTPMSCELKWEHLGKRIVHYHDLRWDKLATAEESSLQALQDDGEATTQVEQLSRAFVLARAIYIACCLNTFESIHRGQKAPAILQKRLEQSGLVTSEGLTDLGKLFLDKHCRAFILHDNEYRWKSLGRLQEAVKEGVIPFEDYSKSNFFQYLQNKPEAIEVFTDAMTFISEHECKLLATSLNSVLQPSHTLIDVGGGAGRFIQELRPLYPHVKGIVFDLPDIKESILPGCIFYGGNFFEFVPPADIYHFKRVLHDWSDEDCIKILQTCAASAKEGSRLVLHEFLLPQPEALMIDTYFMSLFRGRQRTQEEFATLLKTAGWNILSCQKTACWLGQIVATKA